MEGMNEDKKESLKLAGIIRGWTLSSLFVSVLLLFSTSLADDYLQEYTLRMIHGGEWASKNDLITQMHPAYDVQLMRQAYQAYWTAAGPLRTAESMSADLALINNPEDYEKLVIEPGKTGLMEKIISEIYNKANFYQSAQLLLSVALIIFQVAVAQKSFELVQRETLRVETYDGV